MSGPSAPQPGGLEEDCPRCGETPTSAHARGSEVVLVPCGHSINVMSTLEVPPEELDG